MKLTLDQSIAAPRDVVFATFREAPRWPQIVSGINAVGGVSGPLEQGDTFTETRTMFGREATETFEVTDLVADEVLTLTSDSCGVRFVSRHTFEDAGEGRTKVTLSMATQPLTIVGRLMAPLGVLMAGSMKKLIARDMADFAAECEQAANAPETHAS